MPAKILHIFGWWLFILVKLTFFSFVDSSDSLFIESVLWWRIVSSSVPIGKMVLVILVY